jgi:hypothetical protein
MRQLVNSYLQALYIFLFWNCFVRKTSKILFTCVWFTTRSMVFYLNIFRYDMINRRQLFYNSFRTSVAWTKLNLPLSVNIYNFSGLLVWQITHSCQSKEALPLFALVGASFNGLLNCDIFRKFYTTDPELFTTNEWTRWWKWWSPLAIYSAITTYRGVLMCVSQGRIQEGGRTRRAPPLKLEKIWFFCVKSWFPTRNTPKFFAPPSVRHNFFKCAP